MSTPADDAVQAAADDARAHVEEFVSVVFEPDDLVEVRTFSPGGAAAQSWQKASALTSDDVLRTLARQNLSGVGIYVGANPRSCNGGKAEHVARFRCLFVDFDGVAPEQAAARIAAAGLPAPSLLLSSGHGTHAYWRLAAPITDAEVWKSREEALIELLDTDPRVRDTPRVMRLPGFLNTKEEPCPRAVVDEAHPNRRYDSSRFPVRKPPPPPAPPSERASGIGYVQTAVRGEAAKVASAAEGNRNDVLNKAAFSLGTLVGGGALSREAVEAALLPAGLQCGLGEREVRRTIASGLESGIESPRQVPEIRPAPGSLPGNVVPVPEFKPMSAVELIDVFPHLRPEVLEGILRKGEVMNVIAAPKVGKSWLVLGLAVCFVGGVPWLGKKLTQGRVLIIDAELHEETLANRLKKTGAALRVDDDGLKQLDVWPVRGKRLTIDGIAAALAETPSDTYRVIIIDAMYRFLPVDGEENANEAMTRVYNALDAMARQTGAVIVVVHHATKGSQADKAVTDVGAGAGAQSRAADVHLILRPHEEPDCVVVDAVVRSFAPMEPFVIRCLKPGWALEPDLDPKKLKKPDKRRKPKEDKPTPPPGPVWTPETFAHEFVGEKLSIKEDVIAAARAKGLSKTHADSLLKQAVERNHVRRVRTGHSEPHRFTTKPDIQEPLPTPTPSPSGTPPAPGADAPGGVGGTRARPPSPPARRKRKGRS